jgi:hypothetical protein
MPSTLSYLQHKVKLISHVSSSKNNALLFLATGHTISDNSERASVFRSSRLTAFKARRAALKSTTDDNLLQRGADSCRLIYLMLTAFTGYSMTDC